MYRTACLITFLTISVGGCASKHELAKCHGALIVMNTDHWHPTDMEMVELDKICPEDK